MNFLFLSILSSVSVFVLFKFVERFGVHSFSAIVINYLIACFAGFFLSKNTPDISLILSAKWLPIAALLGFLFIVMFVGIAKSTQQSGVAITTVAVKMSVIFPIAFSIWYDAHDQLATLKLTGILLALVAVFLTVYQNKKAYKLPQSFLLPLFLFFGIGVMDSFMKFAQSKYVAADLVPTFSAVVFAFSLIIGVALLPFNKMALKGMLKLKSWLLGLILGVVNFGTVYFLLLALNSPTLFGTQKTSGSVVFGVNNICIVALSVILGYAFFKERPTRINWTGIGLSIVAIGVLAIS